MHSVLSCVFFNKNISYLESTNRDFFHETCRLFLSALNLQGNPVFVDSRLGVAFDETDAYHE